MIADGSGNGRKRNSSLYSGYNPVVDQVTDRNASLELEERFDVSDEISVKQARVVELMKLEKAARDKSVEAAMSVGTLTDKAVDGVLKAKQIGASIHAAGTVWTDYKAKQFVSRILALLELELDPAIFGMVSEQLESVRRSFSSVEGSTYTPDKDLSLMDATIPRS